LLLLCFGGHSFRNHIEEVGGDGGATKIKWRTALIKSSVMKPQLGESIIQGSAPTRGVGSRWGNGRQGDILNQKGEEGLILKKCPQTSR